MTHNDSALLGHATERIAAVIPCYKVGPRVGAVIKQIGPEVSYIVLVDDCCPQQTGVWAQTHIQDRRLTVVTLKQNLGVGGATKAGFVKATELGATLLVKLDGDGQMDPHQIPKLVAPLLRGEADYCKGNRFFSPRHLVGMPMVRILGNAGLSFLTKLSSGYWHIMDPTNGFLAIHAKVFKALEADKIDNRFFFETDLLCRMRLISAVAVDIPIPAIYGDEVSNLRIGRVLWVFPLKHLKRFSKRIVYEYFIRDFNVGSAQLITGLISLMFGVGYAGLTWWHGLQTGVPAVAGQIMVAALPTILGFQLLLAFLNYDIVRRESMPLHKLL